MSSEGDQMKSSEKIGEITKSLLKSQKEMEGAKKGSDNPFFKSKYSDYNSVMGIVDWEKETKKMAVKLEWGETRAAREYIASKDPKDKGMWLSIYRQFQHTKTNFLRKRDINIYNADKIDVHNGDKNIKIDLDTLLDSIDKSKREVIEIVK